MLFSISVHGPKPKHRQEMLAMRTLPESSFTRHKPQVPERQVLWQGNNDVLGAYE